MKKKKGITMISIILYSLLFFSFTAFATAISSNMNYRVLSERGKLYINEEYSKLQYNLYKSAKASNRVDIIGEKIVFSNNDEYYFDSDKKVIFKNGGMLVNSVDTFLFEDSANITQNILTDEYKYVCYKVGFSKYEQTLENSIFVTVGGYGNE